MGDLQDLEGGQKKDRAEECNKIGLEGKCGRHK